jgi:hypothetical protein
MNAITLASLHALDRLQPADKAARLEVIFDEITRANAMELSTFKIALALYKNGEFLKELREAVDERQCQFPGAKY